MSRKQGTPRHSGAGRNLVGLNKMHFFLLDTGLRRYDGATCWIEVAA